MGLLILVLIVLITLLFLIFTISLNVRFLFDTEKEDMHVTLLWLKRLVKVILYMKNARPVYILYLFNRKVMEKTLKTGTRAGKKFNRLDLVKLTEAKDINVNTSYGFRDPYNTGIACGAINVASQFINIDSISQTPDFMAESDYIYVDATARVNMGSTLVRMLKARFGT